VTAHQLPGGLARRFHVAPLTEGDLEEVFALHTADRTAVLGFSRVSREQIRPMLESRWPGVRFGVHSEDGLVQSWLAARLPGAASPFGTVTSHPDLVHDADLEDLESAGWRCLVRWASSQAADSDAAQLRTQRPVPDVGGRERLHREGFSDERTLWVMEASVDAERGGTPPSLEGLLVHGAANPRTVYDVFMSGFAGTFGFLPMSFDEFLDSRSATPGNDPSLWFQATVDGRPVGAMTLARAAPERRAMLVSELAVLPAARGHGVATTLLHNAFEAARAHGMRLLYLFVDSENEDAAPTLYASVGFEMVQATQQLVRPLRFGPADRTSAGGR
jgi:GNAT superfamily N-acetyltransferase